METILLDLKASITQGTFVCVRWKFSSKKAARRHGNEVKLVFSRFDDSSRIQWRVAGTKEGRVLTEKDAVVDVIGVQVEVKVGRAVRGSLMAPLREVHQPESKVRVARGQEFGQQGQEGRVQRCRAGSA